MEKSEYDSEVIKDGGTWFDLMTGYLKWKVIGPDIHNPFKAPHSLANLTRMMTQRDYLCQHVSVRCMCDGYEVMMIVNPSLPRVISNHPCINTMPMGDIIDYLQRHHLDDFIEAELNRIQEEIREHVAERKKQVELELKSAPPETRGLLPERKKSDQESAKKQDGGKKKDGPGKSGTRNYRILKR